MSFKSKFLLFSLFSLLTKKMVQIVEIEDHTTVTVNDEACPAPPLGTPTRAQPRHINKPRRIEPAKQKVDTEEQVNIYSTEDWKDSLDDIGKGGLGLGTVALIGLTVTSTLQRSIDTRDECNTGPDAMLDILKMGGMGFCFVTISLSVSIATKMIARKYKSKNQELFKRRVFRSGVMISALAVVLGLSCLGFYFRDFFEVRLGRRGAFMTNMFLAWGGLGGLMILGAASFAFLTC